jgi:TctA family transporter
MLWFYRLDLTNIMIIFIISIVTFKLIEDKENKTNDFANVIISLFVGFLVSVIFSYSTIESDVLLKENYWD